MILTSIILTAAALYLLTYGGRTSIEETVVARDAMTEHYVTPYYKIESISDDRSVPTPPDIHSVAEEIRIPGSWRQRIEDKYQGYQDQYEEPNVTKVDRIAGSGSLADQISNVNGYVESSEDWHLKDNGFEAFAWAKEHNIKVTWEDGV